MFIISLNTSVYSLETRRPLRRGREPAGLRRCSDSAHSQAFFFLFYNAQGKRLVVVKGTYPGHTPRQAALGPRPPVRAGARGCLTRAGATREPLPPRGRTRALPPGQRGQARDTRALAWSGNASAPAQPQPKPGTRRRRAARAEATAGAAGALFLSSETVQTM